jgi:hypothetical protein
MVPLLTTAVRRPGDGSTVDNCSKERDPGEMVPLLTTAVRRETLEMVPLLREILERWFHC